MDVDYIFKVLLIGDSNVGKTCMLSRFSDNEYTDNYLSTIGVDFKLKTLEYNKQKIKLQLWDTAGQERFRTITNVYYRGAHAIIIVFDLNDYATLENITYWFDQIIKFSSNNPFVILVGNKCDVNSENRISILDIQTLVSDYNIKYIEASAKSNINIDEIFNIVVSNLVITHAKNNIPNITDSFMLKSDDKYVWTRNTTNKDNTNKYNTNNSNKDNNTKESCC